MSDYISKSALIERYEKEIIRNAFERVVERLKEEEHINNMSKEFRLSGSESYYEAKYKARAYAEAIEIVKEECGISE